MLSPKKMRALLLGTAIATLLLATLPAFADYREEFHKTYPVAPNALISLNNVNGGVEISAWDRNEVEVEATKHADSQEKLDRLKIEVNASSNRVDIRTRMPQGFNNNPGHVEYHIHVPKTARLDKIETVNGGIEISGVRAGVRANSVNGGITGRSLGGNVELDTVNGGVDCEVLDFASARTVKLSSVNGGVEIFMPRDSNAHLTANTVHGGIDSDFGLPIQRAFMGANVDTTLGSGNTNVDLHSVNGGISIHGKAKGI